MSSLFDQNNETENTQYSVDQLVGEGRKFKSENDLVKGYVHADAHISELQKELQELRELNQSNNNIEQAKKNQDEANASTPATANNLSTDELNNLVDQKLEQRTKDTIAKENMTKVHSHLKSRFGDKSNDFLQEVMTKNGLTPAQIDNLASTNPDFVINSILGGNVNTQVNTATIQPTVNTEYSDPNILGHKHFTKIRKENPKFFYSREGQAQFKAAVSKLGSDFTKY